MAKHLIVELDALLLEKGKTSNDIIRATGHNKVNVSKIRAGRLKGIRADTLFAICLELDCQPGDVLKIVNDEELELLIEERRKNREARVESGAKITAPEKVYVIEVDDDDDDE